MNKVVFVGAGGVGKTSLVKKLQTGKIPDKYLATIGAETYNFRNSRIWDTAGNTEYAGLEDGYYIQADYFIVMFDHRDYSRMRLSKYIKDITRINTKKNNIIICQNKCELGKYPGNTIKINNKNYPLISVSLKRDINLNKLKDALDQFL